MSKRFVDTELWQKEWFQNLSLKHKVLVKYIFENCDCAGVWNGNFRMASFIIGENVTIYDLKSINSTKYQFEILENGNIFIPDFIKFQYGTLSENCKPHKPVIEKLKKYNLYERVFKGFPKGIETLEEKEIEKEIEKEQYKEKEKDIICNLDFEKCFKIYSENCTNLIPLSFERRAKNILEELREFLVEIDYDFSYFLNLCKKANSLEKIVNSKIDFRSMIRNHIGIINGKYEQPTKGITKETIQAAMQAYKLKKGLKGG